MNSELPRSVQKWLKALRSGKYIQNRGALRDAGKYCCLGVACDISGLGEWSDNDDSYFIHDNSADEILWLPDVVKDWLRLETGAGCFHRARMINKFQVTSLSSLNDDLEWSFEKIADFIEQNWELIKRNES